MVELVGGSLKDSLFLNQFHKVTKELRISKDTERNSNAVYARLYFTEAGQEWGIF